MTIKLDAVAATQEQKTGIISDLRLSPRRGYGRGTVLVQIGDSNTDDFEGRPGWQAAVNYEWLGAGGFLEGATDVNLGQNGAQLAAWVSTIATGDSETALDVRGSLWSAVNNNPDLIYFRLGTNELFDAARRASAGVPATMQANLDTAINFLLEHSTADIMLVCPAPFAFSTHAGTPPPFILGDYADDDAAATYSAQLRDHHLTWVGKNPRVIVFDTHKDLFGLRIDDLEATGIGTDGCDQISGLPMMADDLHNNDFGYRRLAQYIARKMTGGHSYVYLPQFTDDMLMNAIWSETMYMFQQEVSGTLLSVWLDPYRTIDGAYSEKSNADSRLSFAKRATNRALVAKMLGAVNRLAQMGGAANALKAYCHNSGKLVTMTSLSINQYVTATPGDYYAKLSCVGQSEVFDNDDVGPITFFIENASYLPQNIVKNNQKESLSWQIWVDIEEAVATSSQVVHKFRYGLSSVVGHIHAKYPPSGGTCQIQVYKNVSAVQNLDLADGIDTATTGVFTDFASGDTLALYCSSNTGSAKGLVITLEGYRNLY